MLRLDSKSLLRAKSALRTVNSKAVLRTAGAILMVAGMMLFWTGGATAAPGGGGQEGPHNPPGNNGTIKIDDVPFDDHPNNEPHVGCTFQVDFYGYDEGDLFAEVTFETQPPTKPVTELLTDTVFIGEDDSSGGGSEAGLDASETYTLDLTGFEPHDIQGFHVKLTINADGSQGADVKHKVFWVSGCEEPPPTTSEPPPVETSEPPPVETSEPPPVETSEPPPVETSEPPAETETPDVSDDELPETGASFPFALAGGIALMLIGFGVVLLTTPQLLTAIAALRK